jgi:hypothetical protein
MYTGPTWEQALAASRYPLTLANLGNIIASIPAGWLTIEEDRGARWPGKLNIVRQGDCAVGYIRLLRRNRMKVHNVLARAVDVLGFVLSPFDYDGFSNFEYRYDVFLHDSMGRLLLSIRGTSLARKRRDDYNIYLPDGTVVAEIRGGAGRVPVVRGVGPCDGVSISHMGLDVPTRLDPSAGRANTWARPDGEVVLQGFVDPSFDYVHWLAGEPSTKIVAAAALMWTWRT